MQRNRVSSCLCLLDNWCNVWNAALDSGTLGTRIAQSTLCLLTRPLFGSKTCPYCLLGVEEQTFPDHLAATHDLDVKPICEAIHRNPPCLFSLPLSDAIRHLVWRPTPSLREEGSGLAHINSLYTIARFLLPLIFIYSCIING